MTTLRPMVLEDLHRFNNINLDQWTEMYATHFYVSYLNRWPELCVVAEADGGTLAGYLIAKVEGKGEHWHSHITALSVAPEFRRSGVGKRLCDQFEWASEKLYDCYFADLFVRVSNKVAIQMYERRGYIVYRTVKGYYGGEEDAFDMRKPLKRDVQQKSIQGAGFEIEPKDLAFN